MTENQIQELRNIIEKMEEKHIHYILVKTVNLPEKPKIIFYGKSKLGIQGYLEINNKTYYFEIRLNKLQNEREYTVSVKIGKMVIVKKLEKVI